MAGLFPTTTFRKRVLFTLVSFAHLRLLLFWWDFQSFVSVAVTDSFLYHKDRRCFTLVLIVCLYPICTSYQSTNCCPFEVWMAAWRLSSGLIRASLRPNVRFSVLPLSFLRFSSFINCPLFPFSFQTYPYGAFVFCVGHKWPFLLDAEGIRTFSPLSLLQWRTSRRRWCWRWFLPQNCWMQQLFFCLQQMKRMLNQLLYQSYPCLRL